MGHDTLKKMDGFEGAGSIIPYMDPFKVRIVGLDIPATPENWFAHCARLQDETDENLEEYVQEILANGQTDEPVDAYRDGDGVNALDGRRTLRSARIARQRQIAQNVPAEKLIAVRVIFWRGTEDELHRINVQSHKHKPLTPMQFARQVFDYYKHVKEDAKKTAERFSCTPTHIKQNILPLFDLEPSVQKAIDEGTISVSVALGLTDKPRAEQKEVLAQMKEAGATKGAAAKNAIAAAKRGEKITTKDKTKPRTARQIGKWRDEIAKEADKRPHVENLLHILDFMLGKPASEWLQKAFGRSLTAAGLVKEPKESKKPREKKVKAPKEPKTAKGKRSRAS